MLLTQLVNKFHIVKKNVCFSVGLITETFLQKERFLGDNQCSTFRAYTVLLLIYTHC